MTGGAVASHGDLVSRPLGAAGEGIMAELVEDTAIVTRDTVARPRVSWGAVFAGTVTAIGLWMLLYAFGLAIGVSTLNVQNAGSAKATGIFTGVWGLSRRSSRFLSAAWSPAEARESSNARMVPCTDS